jgi:rhodanese-related sulfurtransferase
VGLFQADPTAVPRITPQALAEQLAGPHPPVVLDVRARAQYDQDAYQIPGSVRVLPDQVEAWANTEPQQRAVVTYCT